MNVEPIRDINAVENIKKILNGNVRDRLLFVLGINNGLRIGDILKLKVSQLQGLKIGDTLPIVEEKTGKQNVLMVNKSVFRVFQEYLDAYKPSPDSYVFFSRKGKEHLTVEACNRMVKSWCRAVGLKGNYGTHTLRKTWGYIQHSRFGASSEIICRRFNHSSPRVTMRYLGITSADVETALLRDL